MLIARYADDERDPASLREGNAVKDHQQEKKANEGSDQGDHRNPQGLSV